jgi:hypothetical protein
VNALITYVNLHSVVEKMEKLIRRFRFVPMREIVAEARG